MTVATDLQAGERTISFSEVGPAERGQRPDEVVIAISPAFGSLFSQTIIGLPLAEVIRQILAGIEEQEVSARIIRIQSSSDLALMAHTAAKLSGSGIGPLLTLETYRNIGSNAAQYAKGESPEPVPTLNDQMARPRWQAKAALLHLKETELVRKGARPVEVTPEFSTEMIGQ